MSANISSHDHVKTMLWVRRTKPSVRPPCCARVHQLRLGFPVKMKLIPHVRSRVQHPVTGKNGLRHYAWKSAPATCWMLWASESDESTMIKGPSTDLWLNVWDSDGKKDVLINFPIVKYTGSDEEQDSDTQSGSSPGAGPAGWVTAATERVLRGVVQ